MKLWLTATSLAIGGALVFVGCSATRFGYESPAYKSRERVARVEIREYPDLILAQTSMDPEREGSDGSFMRLFRFISRGNSGSQKVAMTTPVLFRKESERSKLAFVMPAELSGEGVPSPADPAVEVARLDGGLFAALRVRGGRTLAARRAGVEQLQGMLSGSGWRVVGEPAFASYDPPWIPRVLQKNEVLWRVEKAR